MKKCKECEYAKAYNVPRNGNGASWRPGHFSQKGYACSHKDPQGRREQAPDYLLRRDGSPEMPATEWRAEMKHKKKSRLAAAEFLAVLIVTAVVFTKGLSAALAWRGYKAIGGEFMLLLLPIIYYEAKRIILDFVADFVELYRRAED